MEREALKEMGRSVSSKKMGETLGNTTTMFQADIYHIETKLLRNTTK